MSELLSEQEELEPEEVARGTREAPFHGTPFYGTKVGRIAGFAAGAALVRFEGLHGEPIPARSVPPLDAEDVGREAVLQFEEGDLRRPLITGLLQPSPTDALFSDEEASAHAELELEEAEEGEPLKVAARVDGERVEIEGDDEIVLRCGKASITLRRNGRVVIRGTYVETRSSGTNRIKGGSVRIN